MEAPVFAVNSLMGPIGGTLRTFADDLEDEMSEDDDSIFGDEIQGKLSGIKNLKVSDLDPVSGVGKAV